MQIPVSKKHMPLIVRVFLGLLLAPIGVVAGFMLFAIVWLRAMRIKWFREKSLRHNKETRNPAMLKTAGGRSGVHAIVKHVGRRSGRSYSTPVVARPLGDGFVIPLPYDSSVDWCRKVLAAGACTLIWKEQEYTLERPEIIHQSQALKAFPLALRLYYPAGGVKGYLWLHERKEVSETVPNDSVLQSVGVE